MSRLVQRLVSSSRARLAAVAAGALFGLAPQAASAAELGLAPVYTSDLGPEAAPHLAWRLVAAFTTGTSTFQFETMVLKPVLLPAGRVEPSLAAELDYTGADAYKRRLFEHLKRALVAEGNDLLTRVVVDRFVLRLDLLGVKPTFPDCVSPRCEALDMADVAGLLNPGGAGGGTDPLGGLGAALTNTHVAAVLQPTPAELAIVRSPLSLPLYRVEVRCDRARGCDATLL
jgi:hypothetical protein